VQKCIIANCQWICAIDNERETVRQLCERWCVAWRWDLACGKIGLGGTSMGKDGGGQVGV